MKIVLKDISKRFGDTVLWENGNIEFEPNSLTVIRGKSGSGKSTLLNCIGLLDFVFTGKIYFDTTDVTKSKHRQRVKYYKNTIGFLFQNYGLIDTWTVKENLKLIFKFSKTPKKNIESVMISALETVGLGGYLSKPIFQLSGGEQQRVALAKLIISKPKIILCDEPSAALDIENTLQTINILKNISQKGSVVIIASHDPLFIEHADKIINISDKTISA